MVRKKRAQSTLFLTPLDARTAFYYGVRADSATSVAKYGMPGRSASALPAYLDSLAATGLPFYHVPDVETMDFARNDTLTRGQEALKGLAKRFPSLAVRNGMPLVLQVRAKKSDAEMALIRQAAEISAEGHRAAMLTANPTQEYELRATLEYEFTRRGAERPAYGSIVGAGINGTTLHYMKASDPAKPGDLVVMDAAAEYRGYAADITRTIPVSGTYTAQQRQLYQLVRDAQDIAERFSKPGMSVRAATDSSVALRARGLAALGLVESVEASFDPPWNVNCTIEPGIYVSTKALDVLPDTPKNRAFIAKVRTAVLKYQNTGVRIEDDYIITGKGLERISLVPREMDEIEALMKRRAKIQPE